MHFLEHASLISLSQVQALFMDKGRVVLPIPPHRYLLGLSDLTGELMRFATNAVGSGDAGDVVLLVLNLIRDLQSGESSGRAVWMCSLRPYARARFVCAPDPGHEEEADGDDAIDA